MWDCSYFSYKNEASQIDEDELLRIRDAMISRGPDGKGVWISFNQKVGMAHRRLSIIDLTDAGSQPMPSADESYCIIFNGEIYNYQALRIELKKKGYQFRSDSDTEVLLNLYSEKGSDMVHDLRGMYAFAIWDEKKQGMFLARDPFGIKPLYYIDDGKTLRTASQVKALIKGGHIDTNPEPAGHVGFFLWGYVPEPFTLYKGVYALPAGSTLWIDSYGCHGPVKYFDLSDEIVKIKDNSFKATKSRMKDCLRAELVDSVQHHLIADVPVGIFLSSGLDSITLAALASECSQNNIHTITLGVQEYQGTVHDETKLAKQVALLYNTNHKTRWISKNEFNRDIEYLLEAMDQPSVDGVNTYFVSKVASESGLKTAISGIGGDELFAGYPSFSQIPLLVRSLTLFPLSSFGKEFRVASLPLLKRFTSPKYAGLLEYGGSYGGAYLLRRGLFMPWELPDLLDREMVKLGWKTLQPIAQLEETVNGIKQNRLKISALEMSWYMRNQLLKDADWAGMAHSLEIRLPLVDIKLFRSVLTLLVSEQPPSKRDMISTPIKEPPDELIDRPKTGFSVPVREWLMGEKSNNFKERGLRNWAKLIMERAMTHDC